jgi:dephospho-CoA kinase
MILIGLTGILGSGKSTVTALLRKRGLSVIDLDALARDSLNWEDTRQDIKATFGDEYVVDERVDVEKLRQTAFADRGTKEKLESIIHPRIEEKVHATLEELRRKGIQAVVVDHPLLFEVGFQAKIDKIVVVTAEMGTVRERLKKRGMAVDDIEKRLAFQIPLKEKEKAADYVIDNNRTEDQLVEQIDSLLEKITKWEESTTCI